MQLRGKIEIICWDSQTGKVRWKHQQSNLIPDATLASIVTLTALSGVGQPNDVFASARISISTSTATPDRLVSSVSGILATGYVPVGATTPAWVDGVPDYGRIQNRIDAVGTSRTFDTLALTTLTSNNAYPVAQTGTALAYVLLTTSCTQGALDILDLFYRIEFLNTNGENINEYGLEDFGKRLFNLAAFPIFRLFTSPFSAYTTPYEAYYQQTLGTQDVLINTSTVGSAEGNWDSLTSVASHFKAKYTKYFSIDHHNGKIFNTMFMGSRTAGNIPYGAEKFLFSTTSPLQTNFGKGASSTVPFLDTLNPKVGSGTCALSGSWTGSWPEMYRFNITASGASGVATYTWRKRVFLGFQGNTYTDAVVTCPFRNITVIPNTGFHGWQTFSNDILSLSDTEIVQYDQDGVTTINLITGAHRSWDTTTTPALTGATNIRQCAVDKANRRIYVACRAGGLYEINVDANTVTRHVTDPCHGVDVGNGRVFAIIASGGTGRLTSSVDWTATLAFTFVGISDANWTRVQYIKCDPFHADNRLCIVFANAAGTAYNICWWNLATTTAAAGPTTVELYPASLDVSDGNSFWACLRPGNTSFTALTYGSATHGALLGTAPRQSVTHPIYGTYTMGKVAFYDNYLITSTQLTTITNTAYTTYTSLGTSFTFVVHVGKGIQLTSGGQMRVLITDNNLIWESYGWDGSQWVLGNTSSRATSSTPQSLGSNGNGLSVAFTDGASVPHFNNTDFYLQAVCQGILKHNQRDVTYITHWYAVPAQFEEAVTGTIPASAPYQLYLPESPSGSTPDSLWVRAETDTLGTMRLAIDGVSATVKTSLAPAPGEILVDGLTGLLTFNAADAGKALTGTYNYVRYGI